MELSALSEVLLATGVLLLVCAYIFRRFPPKAINGLYGYRTPRSRRSEEAWAFAQKLSSLLLLRFSVGLVIVGLISLLIDTSDWLWWVPMGILLALLFGGFGFLFYHTERTLHKRFD